MCPTVLRIAGNKMALLAALSGIFAAHACLFFRASCSTPASQDLPCTFYALFVLPPPACRRPAPFLFAPSSTCNHDNTTLRGARLFGGLLFDTLMEVFDEEEANKLPAFGAAFSDSSRDDKSSST